MRQKLALLAACALATACDNQPPRTSTNGRELYELHCAFCHGAEGQGIAGLHPPLVGAEWTNGAANRLSALMLDGLQGEVVVRGATYRGVMPAWKSVLSDAQIAAVLTYVRQSWGNAAPPVSALEVSVVRRKTAPRNAFWTGRELEANPPAF